MSTTLLDVSAGASAGLSNGFRVALAAGGAIGISCRVTTGAGGTVIPTGTRRPLKLHLISSNLTDGPTVAADIQTQLGGGGALSIDLNIGESANAIRFTETSLIASGPVMYGYIETVDALSAAVAIEVEALEL